MIRRINAFSARGGPKKAPAVREEEEEEEEAEESEGDEGSEEEGGEGSEEEGDEGSEEEGDEGSEEEEEGEGSEEEEENEGSEEEEENEGTEEEGEEGEEEEGDEEEEEEGEGDEGDADVQAAASASGLVDASLEGMAIQSQRSMPTRMLPTETAALSVAESSGQGDDEDEDGDEYGEEEGEGEGDEDEGAQPGMLSMAQSAQRGLLGVLATMAEGGGGAFGLEHLDEAFAELGLSGIAGAGVAGAGTRFMGVFGGRAVMAVCFDALAKVVVGEPGGAKRSGESVMRQTLVVEALMSGLIEWMRAAERSAAGDMVLAGRSLPPLGRGPSPIVALLLLDLRPSAPATLQGAALLHARRLPRSAPLQPASSSAPRQAELVMAVPQDMVSAVTVCAAATAARRGYGALATEVPLGMISILYNLGFTTEREQEPGASDMQEAEAELAEEAEAEAEAEAEGASDAPLDRALRSLRQIVRESRRSRRSIERLESPDTRFMMLYTL
jgi:hypothetical protein